MASLSLRSPVAHRHLRTQGTIHAVDQIGDHRHARRTVDEQHFARIRDPDLCPHGIAGPKVDAVCALGDLAEHEPIFDDARRRTRGSVDAGAQSGWGREPKVGEAGKPEHPGNATGPQRVQIKLARFALLAEVELDVNLAALVIALYVHAALADGCVDVKRDDLIPRLEESAADQMESRWRAEDRQLHVEVGLQEEGFGIAIERGRGPCVAGGERCDLDLTETNWLFAVVDV